MRNRERMREGEKQTGRERGKKGRERKREKEE